MSHPHRQEPLLFAPTLVNGARVGLNPVTGATVPPSVPVPIAKEPINWGDRQS